MRNTNLVSRFCIVVVRAAGCKMPDNLKLFLCTGFSSSEKQILTKNIEKLGGSVTSSESLQTDDEFILICADLKRTEKFMMACAAGMWVVVPEFVEDSLKAGHWMAPQKYEWTIEKQCRLSKGSVSAFLLEVPQRWRRQVKHSRQRAFVNWRVVLLVGHEQNRAAYSRILKFGGADIILKRNFKNEEDWKSITHTFIDDEYYLHHKDLIKNLTKQGHVFLSPVYIGDFISQFENPGTMDCLKSSSEFVKPRRNTECDAMVSEGQPNMKAQDSSNQEIDSNSLQKNLSLPKLSSTAICTQNKKQHHAKTRLIGHATNPVVLVEKIPDDLLLTEPKNTNLFQQIELRFSECEISSFPAKKIQAVSCMDDSSKRLNHNISTRSRKRINEENVNFVPTKRIRHMEKSEPGHFVSILNSKTDIDWSGNIPDKVKLTAKDGFEEEKMESSMFCVKEVLDKVFHVSRQPLSEVKEPQMISTSKLTSGSLPDHLGLNNTRKENVDIRLSFQMSNVTHSYSSGAVRVSPLKQDPVTREVEKVMDQECICEDQNTALPLKTSISQEHINLNAGDKTLFAVEHLSSGLENVSLNLLKRSKRNRVKPPQTGLKAPAQQHGSENYQAVCASVCLRDEITTLNAKDSENIRKQNSQSCEESLANQFPNSATEFINACLDEVTISSCSEDSHKKFINAISSFLTKSSYPHHKTLSTVFQIVMQENVMDIRLIYQIHQLLQRLLVLHPPVTTKVKETYTKALGGCSDLQNWEIMENLFRKLISKNDPDKLRSELCFLQFIVHFLQLEFQESKKRFISAGNGFIRSLRWCVIGKWLWKNECVSIHSFNLTRLITTLVSTIQLSCHPFKMDLIRLAQTLTSMAAEAWLLYLGLSLESAFVSRDLWVFGMVLADQLRGSGTTADQMKLFFETCTTDWLAMVVSKILLDRMNVDGLIDDRDFCLNSMIKYFKMMPFEEDGADSSNGTAAIQLDSQRPSKALPRLLPKKNNSMLKMNGVNKPNHKGEVALHISCRKNNIKHVRELLNIPGIDVNKIDFAGWTPLHEACIHGNIEVVKELLRFKPNRLVSSYFSTNGGTSHNNQLNLKAASLNEGYTPLHDAVMNNHVDICRLLLHHGGQQLLEISDAQGKRPHDYATTDDMKQVLSENHMMKNNRLNTDPSLDFPSTQSESGSTNVSDHIPINSSPETQTKPISSDCLKRYCFLVSNLFKLYMVWKGKQLTGNDGDVLRELPKHINTFRLHLQELGDGVLLPCHATVLAKLQCLVDVYVI